MRGTDSTEPESPPFRNGLVASAAGLTSPVALARKEERVEVRTRRPRPSPTSFTYSGATGTSGPGSLSSKYSTAAARATSGAVITLPM